MTLGRDQDADEEGEKVMPSSLMRAVIQANEAGGNPARLYSLILFGPPGTAKTTIATNLASVINYNFVTIDTATFLADGLEIFARAGDHAALTQGRLNGCEQTKENNQDCSSCSFHMCFPKRKLSGLGPMVPGHWHGPMGPGQESTFSEKNRKP